MAIEFIEPTLSYREFVDRTIDSIMSADDYVAIVYDRRTRSLKVITSNPLACKALIDGVFEYIDNYVYDSDDVEEENENCEEE